MVVSRPIDLSSNNIPETNKINKSLVYRFSSLTGETLNVKVIDSNNDYNFNGYQIQNTSLNTNTSVNFDDKMYYFNRLIVSTGCDKINNDSYDYSLIIENVEYLNNQSFLYMIIPIKNVSNSNKVTNSMKGILPTNISDISNNNTINITGDNIELNNTFNASDYYYYYMNGNTFVYLNDYTISIQNIKDIFETDLQITIPLTSTVDVTKVFYSNQEATLGNPSKNTMIEDDIYIDCSPEGDATSEIIKPKPIYKVSSFINMDSSFNQLIGNDYIIFSMIIITIIVFVITFKLINNMNNFRNINIINYVENIKDSYKDNSKRNELFFGFVCFLSFLAIVFSSFFLVRSIISDNKKNNMTIYSEYLDVIFSPILTTIFIIFNIYHMKSLQEVERNRFFVMAMMIFIIIFVLILIFGFIFFKNNDSTTSSVVYTDYIIYSLLLTPVINYLIIYLNKAKDNQISN